MALIRINDADPKDTGKKEYEMIKPGFYEVYIMDVDYPEAIDDIEKSSITLVIRDDIEQEFKRQRMWVNISTNPNIAWKLSNIARAAGVPAGTDFDGLADYLAAIKGASMKVKVDHREYNDKVYVDVKGFYPTSEASYAVEPDLDDDLI